MEIGDLFYIIILSLFMILGFFNDSRKKKNEQKQQSEPKPHSNQLDEPEVIPPLYKKIPPPLPKNLNKKKAWERDSFDKFEKEGEVVFQSSLGLLTDFSKESSLKSSIYQKDTGSTYDQDTDSHNDFGRSDKNLSVGSVIQNDLAGDYRREELVKGLIYSEILKKKY